MINTSSVGEFRRSPRYNDHNVGILCAASRKNGDLERIRRKGDTNSVRLARNRDCGRRRWSAIKVVIRNKFPG